MHFLLQPFLISMKTRTKNGHKNVSQEKNKKSNREGITW